MLLAPAIVVAFESNLERKAKLYPVDTFIEESKLRLPKQALAELPDLIRLGAQRKMKLLRPRYDNFISRQDGLLTPGLL